MAEDRVDGNGVGKARATVGARQYDWSKAQPDAEKGDSIEMARAGSGMASRNWRGGRSETKGTVRIRLR